MTSERRHAPELTTGPTTPIEIRAIYDTKGRWRVETRECGRLAKTTSSIFPETFKLEEKIKTLSEAISDAAHNIILDGSEELNDYSIHISMQPVLDMRDDNVPVYPN